MSPAPRIVRVRAPSRLHFGLFAFGSGGPRQFGGAGAMIEQPGLELRLTAAEAWSFAGPMAERARRATEALVADSPELQAAPRAVEVLRAPPEHVGLGTGTQLCMALALALCGERSLSPRWIDRVVGGCRRGQRSAIGIHGFVWGGLLVDDGKRPGEALSPLVARVDLPPAWRFVLAMPRHERGLSGEAERAAFAALPPVPEATSAALRREALQVLLPAAQAGDFAGVSASLARYGRQAGACYAAQQGGVYANPRIAGIVTQFERLGVQGVGQSSWGPTVFALLPDDSSALAVVAQLRRQIDRGVQLIVASPANGGGRIAIESA